MSSAMSPEGSGHLFARKGSKGLSAQSPTSIMETPSDRFAVAAHFCPIHFCPSNRVVLPCFGDVSFLGSLPASQSTERSCHQKPALQKGSGW